MPESLARWATLLKQRLWHRCFPVNFVKFLRTPFLQNTSGRLLLYFMTYFLFAFSIIAWKLILSNKQIFDTRVLLVQTHLRKQVCVFIFLYQNMLIKYLFKHLFSIRIFSWQETKKQLLKFQKNSREYLQSKTFLLKLQAVCNLRKKFSPPQIFSDQVILKGSCIKTWIEN